jgi:hypothetical protein
MKSLAHKDWPYTGTPHEWRGFYGEFRKVYQGGHHTVWCNGKNHQKTEGGYAAIWDQGLSFADSHKVTGLLECDCEYWLGSI